MPYAPVRDVTLLCRKLFGIDASCPTQCGNRLVFKFFPHVQTHRTPAGITLAGVRRMEKCLIILKRFKFKGEGHSQNSQLELPAVPTDPHNSIGDLRNASDAPEGRTKEGKKGTVSKFLHESCAEVCSHLQTSEGGQFVYWSLVGLCFVLVTLVQMAFLVRNYLLIPTGTEVQPQQNHAVKLPNMTLWIKASPRGLMGGKSWEAAEVEVDDFLAQGGFNCSDPLGVECPWLDAETECVTSEGCAQEGICSASEAPYFGAKNVTENGEVCRNWQSTTMSGADYEREFYLGDHNQCRVVQSSRPWCYTDENSWGYCFPACDIADTVTNHTVTGCIDEQESCIVPGLSCGFFEGTKNQTRDGEACAHWENQLYQEDYEQNGAHSKLLVGKHNYCRVTPDSSAPWCTTATEKGWGHCFYTCKHHSKASGPRAVLAALMEYFLSWERFQSNINAYPVTIDTARHRAVAKLIEWFKGKETLARIYEKFSLELCKLLKLHWQFKGDDGGTHSCHTAMKSGLRLLLAGSSKWIGFVLPFATNAGTFKRETDELLTAFKIGRMYPDWKFYLSNIALRSGRTPILLEMREKFSGYISDLGVRLEPGTRQNILMELNAVYELLRQKRPHCLQLQKSSWQATEQCKKRCAYSALAEVCRLENCKVSIEESLGSQIRLCTLDDYRKVGCNSSRKEAERKAAESRCLRGCHAPCTRVVYQAFLKEKYNLDEWHTVKEDKATEVSFWFGSFAFTLFEEVPLMPTETFLSELGGTLGLYLGLSMVPVAHFLLFIAKELYSCMRTRSNRPTS